MSNRTSTRERVRSLDALSVPLSDSRATFEGKTRIPPLRAYSPQHAEKLYDDIFGAQIASHEDEENQ
jgi:hypothetical protein